MRLAARRRSSAISSSRGGRAGDRLGDDLDVVTGHHDPRAIGLERDPARPAADVHDPCRCCPGSGCDPTARRAAAAASLRVRRPVRRRPAASDRALPRSLGEGVERLVTGAPAAARSRAGCAGGSARAGPRPTSRSARGQELVGDPPRIGQDLRRLAARPGHAARARARARPRPRRAPPSRARARPSAPASARPMAASVSSMLDVLGRQARSGIAEDLGAQAQALRDGEGLRLAGQTDRQPVGRPQRRDVERDRRVRDASACSWANAFSSA